MTGIFTRQSISYGKSDPVETPFMKASEVWDRRLGSARVQAGNWRLMAFLLFFLSLGLAIGFYRLAGQNRIVPYVVEVGEQGEVRNISPALESYHPDDAVIAWHLSHFIEKFRSLPSDPVVLRENWLSAYDMVSDSGALYLSNYAREHDPFKALGIKTVSVEVTSIVRASRNSFQIKWQEKLFRNGDFERTDHYTAILGVILAAPDNEEMLRKNPLGIYVHEINWNRDYVPASEQGDGNAFSDRKNNPVSGSADKGDK